MPASPQLTPELWSLLGFAVWPIILVLALGTWRVLLVLTGKKRSNEFPSGTQHGTDTYWRLNRAHMNTLENLPIFAALVFLAYATGAFDGTTAVLAPVALAARVAQSLIHIASGSAMAVNLRVTAYVVQLICFAGLALQVLQA